jgi:tungstate transport system ATP-binding protein
MITNTNNLLPVSIKNLNYVRGGKSLLNKIYCEIKTKGITIILGPNGAGKTLLLKCMHGLINFNTPRIFYAKKSLNKKIRMQQSMVFQNPILLKRSVKSNILFVLKQRKIKLKEDFILKTLQKLDLLGLVNEKAIFLSGGEKQRLSMARAIITEPKILFLDEATSNLDPYSIQIIEKMITEVRNKGTKVIAVTHDLAQAKRLADDIIFISKGKVSEYTLAKSFFKKPKSKDGKLYISGKLII